jgi:DNA-binding transcriptional ArsR family regulator
MSGWAFLTNHALVLSLIARNPELTAVEVAEAIGIRERAVRRIIGDLEDAGYISKKKEGRRNRYFINPDLPLRHRTQHHVAVGELLRALGWQWSTSTLWNLKYRMRGDQVQYVRDSARGETQ